MIQYTGTVILLTKVTESMLRDSEIALLFHARIQAVLFS